MILNFGFKDVFFVVFFFFFVVVCFFFFFLFFLGFFLFCFCFFCLSFLWLGRAKADMNPIRRFTPTFTYILTSIRSVCINSDCHFLRR